MPKRRRTPTAPPSKRSVQATGSGRWTSSRELGTAAALGLLAALLRALFILSGDDRAYPYTVFYEGDAEAYFRFARSFFDGTLYDQGVPFHPPGFAFALAGLHALFGATEVGAQVPHLAVKIALGGIVGGGSVAALYLLARRFFERPVALVAALLAAFHFGLYVLSVAPVADGLFQLLLLVSLLLVAPALADGEAPRPRRALALGLLLGALTLTRAEGALPAALIVAFGAGATWRSGRLEGTSPGRRLRPWLWVVAAALVVVAPWTIRNAIRLGQLEARLGASLAEPLPRFVPVTMYGPINLALANHAGADGAFSRKALASEAGSGMLRFENPEHLRFVLHGDELARAWIAEHPGEFARLVLRKWRLYFGALDLGWTQWNLPGGRSGVRRPVDVFVPDRRWGGFLLAGLTLTGALLAFRGDPKSRRFVVLAASLTVASLAVIALFFGYARLGLILLPLWLVLAAVALARLGRFVRIMPGLAVGRARRLGLAVVVVLAGVELYGALRGHRLEAIGTTYGGSRTLDRDQPIRFRPLP